MKPSNFARALALVLKSEGGYADNPKDPGGATNLGITLATLRKWRGRDVTKAEVKALTREAVAPIYKAWYWAAVKADDLPLGLDYAVFDFAVNSGPRRAAEFLQQVLGVKVDGAIGPITIAAARKADTAQTVGVLMHKRLAWLKTLPTWPVFKKGWTNRITFVTRGALAMAGTTTTLAALAAETLPQPEKTSMLKSMVLPFIRMAIPNTIRHVSQMAAGALVAQGVIASDQQTLIVGALVCVVSGLWSLAEKKGLVAKALEGVA